MWMLYLLPKNTLSRLIGKLVHIKWPGPFKDGLIYIFGKYYKIHFDEAEKPISEYHSIGDFFIRKLKAGVRPIGNTEFVHPTDSQVSQVAEIKDGLLIQAKGKTYNLVNFTGHNEALKKWGDGIFLTYYLCPTDYHRVHSPVAGKIFRATHIPGHLWPVNKWSTTNINDLFSVNERVIVEIETTYGDVGVVFVGATNVGDMVMTFDSEISTNKRNLLVKQVKDYSPNIPIEKGEELGMFKMGSTIVLLLPRAVKEKQDLQSWLKFFDQKVKIGGELV